MEITQFLTLLFVFSIISSLVTEAVKQLKQNFSSSLMALIVALIVGCGGSLVYFYLTGTGFTPTSVLFSILLGLASGLCSTVGYDKVKDVVNEVGKLK